MNAFSIVVVICIIIGGLTMAVGKLAKFVNLASNEKYSEKLRNSTFFVGFGLCIIGTILEALS